MKSIRTLYCSYQSTHQDTTRQTDTSIISYPLFLYPENTLLTQLSTFEINWIMAQHKDAVIHNNQLIMVPDESGNIAKIFLGIKLDSLHFALGNLAHNLPKGNYFLANSDQFNNKELFNICLGFGLGAYRFDDFKTSPPIVSKLMLPESVNEAALYTALDAIFLTRDLINQPANVLNPDTFCKTAKDIAHTFNAQYSVVTGDELLTQNFPLIHAVGRASMHSPCLIEIHYGQEYTPKLTLVGKGVCFDSGGLDIKAAAGMRLMKKDMGGAAHALALGQWIMANKWPINLTILLPVVENSISSNAFRPGDIIKSRSGLTVEIDNTDAEGRLILADTLSYASESLPDLLIDFATLTGAARIALGTDLPAFFSTDDALSALVMQLGNKENDPLWPMPLYTPYKELITSNYADLINSSTQPYGGAITAALFLQSFVPDVIKWAHIDVMAYNLKSRPARPEGGEAMGLRTFYQALSQYFSIAP